MPERQNGRRTSSSIVAVSGKAALKNVVGATGVGDEAGELEALVYT
jgi:hypothetical protein